MASEDPLPGLTAVENPDAESQETQESESASPPSHEPKIRCRPALYGSNDESLNTFCFAFLAEGAANAVFQVIPNPGEGKESFVFEDEKGKILGKESLGRKVLRLSKGKPKTLRYKEIMEGFENEVIPLFRKTEAPLDQVSGLRNALNLSINESFEEFVMEHEGVAIAPEALTALIAELHTHCPDNRHIEPHHLEERGILLPDMSSVPGSVTTIEIKPKWLLQSPNAPRGAYLCRTCALHASRKAEKTYKGAWICPLALVAGSTAAIDPYVRHSSLLALKEEARKGPQKRIMGPDPAHIEAITNRAVPYLSTGPGHKILQHIRHLQAQLDQKGVLVHSSSPEDDYRLRLAMTLRDCSLFIRIPWADQTAPIEAKLGDLDFKSAGKMGDWTEKEEGLLHGGWYVDLESEMEECWIAQGWKRHVPHYF
ncbi:Inositol-pentakisphosphate 2-kinase [Didymosphaeria variabile]|uniref:Inositol-pentakisphosphate 2-kinase n=1 Tax=Didymosphaeria variabile TaxID=1932322 RepID=A0A9W8XSN7_9PLEO|nr:Inositol-pentakisphosphate 2-kinase [Didymosphaeria variabile]KAJ4356658.1 Inositol-pentakisphosphate 2-kinase [Didymosphaeria variabile]